MRAWTILPLSRNARGLSIIQYGHVVRKSYRPHVVYVKGYLFLMTKFEFQKLLPVSVQVSTNSTLVSLTKFAWEDPSVSFLTAKATATCSRLGFDFSKHKN
jgi:hypothetical protein